MKSLRLVAGRTTPESSWAGTRGQKCYPSSDLVTTASSLFCTSPLPRLSQLLKSEPLGKKMKSLAKGYGVFLPIHFSERGLCLSPPFFVVKMTPSGVCLGQSSLQQVNSMTHFSACFQKTHATVQTNSAVSEGAAESTSMPQHSICLGSSYSTLLI